MRELIAESTLYKVYVVGERANGVVQGLRETRVVTSKKLSVFRPCSFSRQERAIGSCIMAARGVVRSFLIHLS